MWPPKISRNLRHHTYLTCAIEISHLVNVYLTCASHAKRQNTTTKQYAYIGCDLNPYHQTTSNTTKLPELCNYSCQSYQTVKLNTASYVQCKTDYKFLSNYNYDPIASLITSVTYMHIACITVYLMLFSYPSTVAISDKTDVIYRCKCEDKIQVFIYNINDMYPVQTTACDMMARKIKMNNFVPCKVFYVIRSYTIGYIQLFYGRSTRIMFTLLGKNCRSNIEKLGALELVPPKGKTKTDSYDNIRNYAARKFYRHLMITVNIYRCACTYVNGILSQIDKKNE
jgi:hypothetical protein